MGHGRSRDKTGSGGAGTSCFASCLMALARAGLTANADFDS